MFSPFLLCQVGAGFPGPLSWVLLTNDCIDQHSDVSNNPLQFKTMWLFTPWPWSTRLSTLQSLVLYGRLIVTKSHHGIPKTFDKCPEKPPPTKIQLEYRCSLHERICDDSFCSVAGTFDLCSSLKGRKLQWRMIRESEKLKRFISRSIFRNNRLAQDTSDLSASVLH